MSWQAYVDTSLIGTGHVDKAAILSSDGTSVWASSAGFKLNPTEAQAIVGAFKDTSEPKQIQMSGLHIEGLKYFVLKADDSSIYGKAGRTGVIIVRTKLALLIARYPESVQPGVATNTVEKLAAYLVSVNY